MTEFDSISQNELRSLIQDNIDLQYEVERDLCRLNSDEKNCIQSLKEDRMALEALSEGWAGEDAERYILQSVDENERLYKKYMQVFSDEKDLLYEKKKRLQTEEQSILEAMANRGNREK